MSYNSTLRHHRELMNSHDSTLRSHHRELMNSHDSTLRSHHRELEMYIMSSLLLFLTRVTWINMILTHKFVCGFFLPTLASVPINFLMTPLSKAYINIIDACMYNSYLISQSKRYPSLKTVQPVVHFKCLLYNRMTPVLRQVT